MAKDSEIKGEVIGELTEDLRKTYARALAKALIAEQGKDVCKKILEELKRLSTECT